jgi:hypothetical protein
MQLGEYGVLSERFPDPFEIGADGSLEIWLSPDEQPRNWMPMDPRGRLLTTHIFQSDWVNDAARPFHIERIRIDSCEPMRIS